jgi:hypothetical protein
MKRKVRWNVRSRLRRSRQSTYCRTQGPPSNARNFNVIAQCLRFVQSSKLRVLSVLMAWLEPLEVARIPLVPVTRHMHTQPPFSFPVHCALSGPRLARSRGR